MIPAEITELTGITDEMLEDAPSISEKLPEYFDFIGDDIILGHNIASFDRHIIRAIRETEIELPCMLAIWEGLRMSEIRGIRRSDIKDGVLTIHQVVVTVEGQHIAKEHTKTEQSTRQLRLSPYILDLIDKQEGEYIAPFTHNSLEADFLLLPSTIILVTSLFTIYVISMLL